MNKIDLHKGTESLKKVATKAGEVGKVAVSAAKDGAIAISDKAQVKSLDSRMKKYNPLFPDKYCDPAFNLPNLIQIVDDAVRKGIDVCEGSVGWLSNEKGVEVLHLYDEAVSFSGLHFIPAATCDSVYYVDPHNRNNYISIDCYFSDLQDSKLAELQHIAYSLGAKHYWVEIVESVREKHTTSGSASLKTPKGTASGSEESETNSSSQTKSLAEATFSGERKPCHPELMWFAHDGNVKNLIEMRCSEEQISTIKTYTIELSSSSAATMSMNTAVKIDAAVSSLGMKGSFNTQSAKESNRKMLFRLEF